MASADKLYQCIEDEDDEGVSQLLETTPVEFAHLYRSAEKGLPEIVRMLLTHSTDTSFIDTSNSYFNETPFSIAVWNGHIGVALELMHDGRINPNQCGYPKGIFPFLRACECGHVELVREMLDHAQPPDLNRKDAVRRTPLIAACYRKNNLEIVQLLCSDPRLQLDQNQTSNYPLVVACGHSDVDLVAYLIQDGRFPLSAKGPFGETLLHSACESGNLEILRLLLDNNTNAEIDVNATTNEGSSVLDFCLLNSHDRLAVELLQDENIQINQSSVKRAFENQLLQSAVKMLQLGWEPPEDIPEDDPFLRQVLDELSRLRQKSARK